MTENLVFEELSPFLNIRGSSFLSVQELASTADLPADFAVPRVIQRDQPIHVHFVFTQQGTGLINWMDPAARWRCELLLEKFGPDEYALPAPYATKEMGIVRQVAPYTNVVHWNIPPNTIPVGVYRIVGTLNLLDSAGRPGFLAAFADMGMVQIYED